MHVGVKYLAMMVMAGTAGGNVMLFGDGRGDDGDCGLTTLDRDYPDTESQ